MARSEFAFLMCFCSATSNALSETDLAGQVSKAEDTSALLTAQAVEELGAADVLDSDYLQELNSDSDFSARVRVYTTGTDETGCFGDVKELVVSKGTCFGPNFGIYSVGPDKKVHGKGQRMKVIGCQNRSSSASDDGGIIVAVYDTTDCTSEKDDRPIVVQSPTVCTHMEGGGLQVMSYDFGGMGGGDKDGGDKDGGDNKGKGNGRSLGWWFGMIFLAGILSIGACATVVLFLKENPRNTTQGATGHSQGIAMTTRTSLTESA